MKYVTVAYDRVNGLQSVSTSASVVELSDDTVFAFEWRRYRQGDYDPAQNGVGAASPFQTVKGGALVDGTLRVVPWGSDGQSASTSLAFGIDAVTTQIPVTNALVLPTAYPYIVTVGTDEKMLVRGMSLNVLSVERGYDRTPASIHEAGEAVEYIVADQPDEEPVEETQPPPQEIPWPSGYAYATKLLEKLSRPRRRLSIRLANVGGDWSGVRLGSLHSADIQTEGPAGGIVGTVRVIGFAPNPVTGSMELVVEDVW